jgi:hypothetical protein
MRKGARQVFFNDKKNVIMLADYELQKVTLRQGVKYPVDNCTADFLVSQRYAKFA